ncbi:MAG: branched-chain amino acid ABC transporter permease, partial [Acidimicrobiaceae bacterium]|nr:branched-chain amino acid ABC transporter permease [Acidimicrobiaceae bacterium]
TSSTVSGGLAQLYMSTAAYYYAALILVVIVVFVAHRVLHSTLGLSLRSVRDDESAAAASGVRIFRVKIIGFAITAGLTALAGGLYFQIVGFIDPTSAFGQTVATEIAVLAIVGGGGTLAGPIIGAVILVPLQQALGSGGLISLPNGLSLVIYGAIIVGILWWDPRGIVHLVRAGRGLVVSRVRRSAGEGDSHPSDASVGGAGAGGAGDSTGPSQASPREGPPGRAAELEGETARSSLDEGDVRLGRENG